jgi:hypothetical protein
VRFSHGKRTEKILADGKIFEKNGGKICRE